MRDIVVVDFMYLGDVFYRGTCSPGDEDHYTQTVWRKFPKVHLLPVNLTHFTWKHDGKSQFNYLPKKVRQWTI